MRTQLKAANRPRRGNSNLHFVHRTGRLTSALCGRYPSYILMSKTAFDSVAMVAQVSRVAQPGSEDPACFNHAFAPTVPLQPVATRLNSQASHAMQLAAPGQASPATCRYDNLQPARFLRNAMSKLNIGHLPLASSL